MEGSVYIARGLVSGLLKIGHSRDAAARLYSLASLWEPMELLARIPGPAALERELHRHFAASLSGARGIEWFRDDGAVVDFVATLPAGLRARRVFKVDNRPAHRGLPRPIRSTGKSTGARERWAEFEREHGHAPSVRNVACHLCARERLVVIRLSRFVSKARDAIARALGEMTDRELAAAGVA